MSIEPVIVPDTYGPEVDRQIELMDALGLWWSRVVGPWIEASGVAYRIHELFPRERLVQFDCAAFHEWHPFKRGADCVRDSVQTLDPLGKKPAARERVERLHKRLTTLAVSRVPAVVGDVRSVKRSLYDDPDLDGEVREMVLDDGRVFRVQRRFIDGITALGEVARWDAVFTPDPNGWNTAYGHVIYPVDVPHFVGISDDGLVTALMLPMLTHTPPVETAVTV